MAVSSVDHPVTQASLEWQVHLAAREPWKAGVVLVSVGLATGLVALSWRGPLPVMGVIFALLNAVGEFLFPIRYRLTRAGAEMRCGLLYRTIAWSVVRRAYRLPDGIQLSPLERPDRRDRFRGLFLRFAGNEPEVLAFVQKARRSSDEHPRISP
jgi:hypothetical protein